MRTFNIDGIIGWDIEAAEFVRFLDESGGEPVEVYFSTPGGSVFDMLRMFNAAKNYQGQTTAILAGYAMSAGSYIPLAFDRVVAEANAVYMIHNARGGVIGDHNDIIKYGNNVRAMSEMIAKAYVTHTGKDLAEITSLMDAESYFYGQQIVDHGFAHELRGAASEENRQEAVVTAKAAYVDCMAKLAADQRAAADDLMQAVAMISIPPIAGDKQRATQPAKVKETHMDLKQFKSEHSAVAAEHAREVIAGITLEQLNEGSAGLVEAIMTIGAEAERQRSADCLSQLVPGYEDLVNKMAQDGKSKGTDVALAIVQKEKEARANGLANFLNGGNQPVPPAEPPVGGEKQMKRSEFNALSSADQAATVKSGVTIVD